MEVATPRSRKDFTHRWKICSRMIKLWINMSYEAMSLSSIESRVSQQMMFARSIWKFTREQPWYKDKFDKFAMKKRWKCFQCVQPDVCHHEWAHGSWLWCSLTSFIRHFLTHMPQLCLCLWGQIYCIELQPIFWWVKNLWFFARNQNEKLMANKLIRSGVMI